MKRTASMLMVMWGFSAVAAEIPLDSTVSYQGRLDDGGNPANGDYDMRFSLHDAASGGNQVGPTLVFDGGDANPIDVSEGLFSLGLNFGDGVFNGAALWLQIQVRPHGNGGYTTLAPRQPLYAVPYALYALDGPGGEGGFWQARGSNIYNTNSGNVGIGTATPEDNLHVYGNEATIRVQDDDDPNSFATLTAIWAGGTHLKHTAASGLALLDIDASPQDGESAAWIRFFRDTDTTGPKRVRFHRGNGTTLPSADIGVGGAHSFFQLDGGNVGIRTTAPEAQLDVNGEGISNLGLRLHHPGSSTGQIEFGGPTGSPGIVGFANNGNRRDIRFTDFGLFLLSSESSGRPAPTEGIFIDEAGRVGMGTITPSANLQVYKTQSDGRAAVNATNTGTGGAGFFANTNSANTSAALFAASSSSAAAFATIGDVVVNGDATIHGDTTINGTATVDVLEIVGADVAEKFPTREAPGEIAPGTVMEIDRDHPGRLRVARGVYNHRVAGVVSGAGDLPVGAVLGHLPQSEDGPPIALSGRVWVRCDAGADAIEPGDLLTTSERPGHAMKASDPSRSNGALIGKAMSSLAQGERGLVLVLVNLQ